MAMPRNPAVALERNGTGCDPLVGASKRVGSVPMRRSRRGTASLIPAGHAAWSGGDDALSKPNGERTQNDPPGQEPEESDENSARKRPREIAMTACIVGWAHTPFGKLDAETVESLVVRVATEALADAGIAAADVDEIVLGHFNAGFSAQDFTASLVLQL